MAKFILLVLLAGCCSPAPRPQLRVVSEPPPPKVVAERPVASAELERTSTSREPLLERHVLQVGDVKLYNRTFGGGTASLKIRLTTTQMTLAVWRKVPRDTIAFALLVDRVEIRGFAAEGRTVYRRDLPGFTFGDSASGNWTETLSDLPAGTASVSVAFFGNYE